MQEAVDVPEHIIWEILIRTPAQFLLKLKIICKLWYRLISAPAFVNAHLSYARFNSPRSICKAGDRSYDFFTVKLENDTVSDRFDFDIRDCVESQQLGVRASCNGVLLMASDNFKRYRHILPWYLYNPITRQSTKFVIPEIRYSPIARKWALVYEDSIQQYKVVGVDDSSGKCMIFTLMTDLNQETGMVTWRDIDLPHVLSSLERQGNVVLVSKKLHWLVRKGPEYFEQWVYSLDVTKEEISTIKLMPNNSPNLYLFQLDESLCIADYTVGENRLDIWTLADREKNLWNKMNSIHLELILERPLDLYYFPNSKSSERRIQILDWDCQRYIYDFKSGMMTKLIPRGIMSSNCVHINSLSTWK